MRCAVPHGGIEPLHCAKPGSIYWCSTMRGEIILTDKAKYVSLSLEPHLFFARIMKEHALFLEAGFTPANGGFAREAEQDPRTIHYCL